MADDQDVTRSAVEEVREARAWIEKTLGPDYPDESWPFQLAALLLSERRAALEEAAALCESLARDDCSAAYAGRRIRALAAECGEEGRDGD